MNILIEVIKGNDKRWNEIIHDFQDADIYFTYEFFKVSTSIDDGTPVLFYLENVYGRVAYPFLKRSIPFTGDNNVEWFDITTPYGYGGPLIEVYQSIESLLDSFETEFGGFCKDEKIISEFVRFHPLIENSKYNRPDFLTIHIRHTIYLKLILEDKKDIMSNIPSKTRNMIRKAKKNNVKIYNVDKFDYLDKFCEIYKETMQRNEAKEYYYFSSSYFKEIFLELEDSIEMWGAFYNDEVISLTLIMTHGKYIHYHLSGAKQEYMHLGVNNLLLYEIAQSYQEKGYEYFHLGGGYSGDGDSLFKFKKSMSKSELLKYCVGEKIHNKEVYNELVEKREIKDTGFFPLYRSREGE